MQQRLVRRKIDSGRSSHGVVLDLSFGILQRPRFVMNVCAIDAMLVRGVKTVALGKKMLQRAFIAQARAGDRPVVPPEFRRPRVFNTPAKVVEFAAAVAEFWSNRRDGHGRKKIRQVITSAGSAYCQRIR